ncbi:unknown similar to AMEV140 [Mythimna separata entomopoxvirus 'L']|uniref:Uncharacterized protein n=1 Tax=Mythimna separata entomopoxvirus 'L' TaxID=1293572 RepID=A0A916P1Y4_9POXV|nr:unknown similar to AMEV140 [Mythimna separata entomopoxvirus 'L']CCU56380.1 unknown similar to AMEV140 [Mythimna separata entomopoxvirus 'L']
MENNSELSIKKNKKVKIEEEEESESKIDSKYVKIFYKTFERLQEVDKIKCSVCKAESCDKHCIVCLNEDCTSHGLKNRLVILDNNFKNQYYVFIINVPDREQHLIPSRINGKFSIITSNSKNIDKYGKYSYQIRIYNQYNIENIVQYLQDRFNKIMFTSNSVKNKPISKKLSEIVEKLTDYSYIQDTSLFNNDGTLKTYIKKSRNSTITFIHGDLKFLVNFDLIYDNYDKMDDDLKKFLESFDFTGILFPCKVTFNLSTDAERKETLKIKISWGIRIVSIFEDKSEDIENPQQLLFEDKPKINPSTGINKLMEFVNNLELPS